MQSRNIPSKLARLTGAMLVAGLVLMVLPVLPVSATGNSLHVATTGSDAGNCQTAASPCLTVAYAVNQAASGDTIHIAAGTYHENLSIGSDLNFVGAGMDRTILDGNGSVTNHRVIITFGSTTIADLTIQNGQEPLGSAGGGINNAGSLTLTRVKVTNNTANDGGGIENHGSLTIVDSVISNNNATRDSYGLGGGLYVKNAGSVSISKTTISGNTASGWGGGVHVQGASSNVTLTNVTISGNTAGEGAAFFTTGSATTSILNSTISDNYIDPPGPVAEIVSDATIYFKNTIVGYTNGVNCAIKAGGTWVSQGNNLDSSDTCGFTNTGDLQNTDPLLDVLGNYGGPTQTRALQSGSPAIDAGSDLGCPSTDQRGVSRPIDGDTDGTSTCDIGAFERRSANTTATFFSAGAYDGWILESSENSNQGGILNKTAATFNLGDDALDKQYRAILSFNTTALPENTTIIKVTLKIRKQGLVGTDPFTILGGLKVDIRKPYFGTSALLLANDFQAIPSKLNISNFGAPPVNNWYSAILGSAGYPYINLTGTTQFRLQFLTGDNDNNIADYMKFYSGNFATTIARPTLIVEYYVP